MRPLPLALSFVLASLTQAARAQTAVTRASETALGVEGNAISRSTRISGDGAFVVFYGSTTNLVPGDTNGSDDVFRKDTLSGAVLRVSVPNGGLGEGNASSNNCDLSEAGGVVVFESYATNLVASDANFKGDVFWHDVASATTKLVSLADGGNVQGNGHSTFPACDDTGDLIAFESEATNLAGADTNGVKDIYLRIRSTGTTERISLTTAGVEPDGECRLAAVSPDGRWVAFQSDAANLVAGDTNGVTDVFLKDRQTGALTRVSVGTGGVQGNRQSRYPALSHDAAVIAFASESDNWIPGTTSFFDVYVHDRASGATTLVSRHSSGAPSNNASLDPDISRFGRWVVFYSHATNLVQADNNGFADVFLNDTLTGATTRLSIAPGGVEANGLSAAPALSDDGIRAAFESDANNLVAADLNGRRDVFYVDTCGAPPSVYCTGKTTSAGCIPFVFFSGTPSASSGSFNILSNDHIEGAPGIYLYSTGKANLNFHGGKLCVKAPFHRLTTLIKATDGLACTGCAGNCRMFKRNFNQLIQSGLDPALTAGQQVLVQVRQRDPNDPLGFGDNLSDGLAFTIAP